MAEFTEFETEFRINLAAPDLDVARGIEVAIGIEERGRRFYAEKARSVSEPLRPFMKFLAEQEREHGNALDELKKTLNAAKLWIKLPRSEVQKPLREFSAFRRHPGNEHRENVQDIQSLLMAMQMEKKTREFYLKFADNLKNPDGKAFFSSLAEWEKKHYEMLSGIYNASAYVRLET